MIAPLFKLTEAVFELLVPLVMANIIDIGVYNRDKAFVMRSGGILVLLGVLGLACSLTAQYFAAKASFGFGTALRRDVFRHICSFSYAEVDSVGTSTLINRLTNDVNLTQDGVNRFLRLFMRSPFIVIGALIMALTINVKLTLIFAVAVPVLSLVIYVIMHANLPRYKQIQKRLDGVTLSVRENLSGARVIRAFSAEDREKKEFFEKTDLLEASQLSVGRISALLNPMTFVIVYIAIIVTVWQGGVSVNSGSLTQGELIALISYLTQIHMALIAFADLIIIVTKAAASAARVSELLEIRPAVTDSGAKGAEYVKGAPAVCFEGVGFSYPDSDEKALSGISFSLHKGQTLGIIGGTGSGKSTLVNLITRSYDASEGKIMINGADIRDYSFRQLRGMIGLVPQKAVLFSGTVRSNMQWGSVEDEPLSDSEIWQALDIAQAKKFVEQKPDGLDEAVAQGGRNLSGGQRQRLTIARALVRKPEILILDDSASALDVATDARLRKAVAQSSSDKAVIIVSQRASAIKDSDIIMILDDGKCVGIGTHDQLMAECEIYEEICRSQLSLSSGQKEGGSK